MLESGSSGSVRGVLSNEHPYREPGSDSDICVFLNDVHSTPTNGRRAARTVRPFRANRRHRACTPLDNFLGEDLAFTRKGQSEHDFSCWRAPRPPRDAMLAHVADEQLYEQLRIRFYIHQNFPGDDFGVSKIKVMQACLNKLQHFIVRRIGAFAVLEYHHSDTDAFAPIQYIIRF